MKPLRRLGFVESFCAETHDRHAATLLVVGVARIAGPMNQEPLLEAFSVLFTREPLLRATIRHDSRGPMFMESATFDAIPIAFSKTDSATGWQTVLKNELNPPVDSTRHLWRAQTLQRPVAKAARETA